MNSPLATDQGVQMIHDMPAILGGEPIFDKEIPLARPTTVGFDVVGAEIADVLASGLMTNSTHVASLERLAAEYLEVDEVVAVSCCTSGLMLVLRALDLRGEVILPSFTFAATAHAVVWNRLEPVFVDCDPETYTIDPACVAAAMTPETSAIIATYIFGNPPDMTALEDIARDRGLRLIFDAAHAFGSYYGDRHAGTFGDAEVFSLSPTKPLVAGEGGLVSLRSGEVARRVRMGRDYGNPGDYNCRFVGLNARMQEISALLARRNLEQIEGTVRRRGEIALRYRRALASIPGICFQHIPEYCRTTYKDFSLFIQPCEFGIDRDTLAEALGRENVSTRKYFCPPVHLQDAYAGWRATQRSPLPVTELLSESLLSIPLYTAMRDEEIDGICRAIWRIHLYGAEIEIARQEEGSGQDVVDVAAAQGITPVRRK
jgi:dTDP-4-amino-4,6-dideoxygalactose transaminase